MNTSRTALCLVFLLVGTVVAQAGVPKKFQIASEPIETNHVEWAKPLPAGPVRALCLVPIQTQRDVVELAQRLDMKYDIVAFHYPLMGRRLR